MLTRLVNMVLIFALFGFGFLSPFMVTGNVDWLRLRVTYFPQKLAFQYKGNFNTEAFGKAYTKAMAYIGDQRVESLLFYKDYTNISVENLDKPGYIEHAIIRGNSVEKGILSLTTSEPDRLFTVDSVSFELLRKVLDDVSTDHNIEDIFYMGFEGIPVGERGTDVSPLTINNLMLISTFCFVPTVSRFIIMVRPVCDYQGKKGGYLNWYASLPTRVQ